jgi:simple sugar transport system permease protein
LNNFKAFAIKYGFLIVMAGSFLGFGLAEPAFWSWSNMFSILLGITIVGILAIGVTFTLIVDGFDLSIGSTAAISVMISSYVMVVLNLHYLVAIAVAVFLGFLIGLTNGLLIVKAKIPDLLATLGMMFLIQGLQLIPSAGMSIGTGMMLANGTEAEGEFAQQFLFLGQGRLFGLVPIPVIAFAALAILAYFVLQYTKWGRILYAIGGNEKAVKLAGVSVEKYKIAAYVVSGTVSAIAGVLLAARIGRGDVTSGGGLLLDAVAAALIGYAVLGLKKPNALGSVVGVIFIGMLLNGLTMLSLPYYTQDFIKGLVLVAALIFTFGLSKSEL